jgi:two-component system, cell cycle sensor histidine kinase and response regulator CckA
VDEVTIDAPIAPADSGGCRKAQERATARIEAGDRRLAEEVEALRGQLRHAQRLEAMGRLVGGIAHDFNNVLAVISGFVAMARRRTPDNDAGARMLDQALAASGRAAELTRYLLTFSRRQEARPRPLDLNAIATETAKMVGRLLGADIDLSLALDPALGTVLSDPGQIEQVILNLAVNARDAMEGGGRLTIETRNVTSRGGVTSEKSGLSAGDYVMLAVHDTGVGMDPQMQANIFEAFFTTKPPGKGTGLGLATVHEIVRESGGHIRVRSARGEGATFSIYLSRVDLEPDRGETVVCPREVLSGSETILLLEDEPALCDSVREWLMEAGYTVLTANRPGQAIAVAESHRGRIDLLLTDVVLPEMPGPQLATAIAAKRPETAVLYMSGYEQENLIARGILQPACRFIQKPFAVDALSQKIRDALGDAHAAAASRV